MTTTAERSQTKATPHERDDCKRAGELVIQIRRQANRLPRQEHYRDAIRKLAGAVRSLGLSRWCNGAESVDVTPGQDARIDELQARAERLRLDVAALAREIVRERAGIDQAAAAVRDARREGGRR